MEELRLNANGKLLLTGEYAVLDGARSLALPARYGQTLSVVPHSDSFLHWSSSDNTGNTWFTARFALDTFEAVATDDILVAQRLTQLLRACRAQQPTFLTDTHQGFAVQMAANFPNNWGLGTSSTLVALVARWAGVNPYQLLEASFGGSGYDIACAFATGPILYERPAHSYSEDRFRLVNYEPPFAAQLYFVHLGQKQDSRLGIQRYRALASGDNADLVQRISMLTDQWLTCSDLDVLEEIMLEHEQLIAKTLNLPRAHDLYFKDWDGQTKSLGAWGGDFVLATSRRSEADTRAYFLQLGFDTVVPFREMV